MLRMVVPILPEHIWSKVPGKEASSTFQNKPPIIGTGPFEVVGWKAGQYVHLKANPNYWGGAPHISNLYVVTYTNADTMVSDLKLGAIDAAVGVPYQSGGLRLDPRHPDQQGRLLAVYGARFQLLCQPQFEGQPGAARPGLPPPPELRDQPRQDQ